VEFNFKNIKTIPFRYTFPAIREAWPFPRWHACVMYVLSSAINVIVCW